MAKQKPKKKQERTIISHEKLAMRAYQEGQKSGSYISYYGSDSLRSIESGLSEPKLAIIRNVLFLDLWSVGTTKKGDVIQSRNVMHHNLETAYDIFSEIASSAVMKFLTKGQAPGTTSLTDIININSSTEQKMDDRWYDNDPFSQISKHLENQLENPISGGIHDMVDWDKVLKGDKLGVWAKNIFKMAQNIAGDTCWDECTDSCQPIIETIMQCIIDKLDDGIREGDNIMGPVKTKVLANPFEVTFGNMGLPILADADAMNPAQKKLHAKVMQEMQNRQDTMNSKAFQSFAHFVYFTYSHTTADIAAVLYEKFRRVDIFYTALKIFAKHGDMKVWTVVDEILFTALIMHHLTENSFRDWIGGKDIEDKTSYFHHFNLLESKPLDKKSQLAILALDDSKESLHEMYHDKLSLWQVISITSACICEDTLDIDMRLMPVFQQMGYSVEDAAALCGYIDGMNTGRCHTFMTSIYMNFIKENMDYDPDASVQDGQDVEDQVKARVDDYISNYRQTADAALAAEKARLEKQQRQASHSVSQMEGHVSKLQSENENLQNLVKQLEEQNRELHRQLEEAEAFVKEDQEEDTKISYPSLIGEDVKIVVFGGGDNWRVELANRFPNIRFMRLDDQINDTVIVDADIVIVNTFVMAHKKFWPVQNMAKKLNKPLMFFPRAGINSCSNYLIEIYNDFKQGEK